ncbi:MAG: cytochrome c [Ferruginibacter sp.]|nr:cytochrome c [Ferruginibacter sp.]
MKLLTHIIPAVLITSAVIFAGCDSKRSPGSIYMPDMAYSRAYESFANRDSTKFTMDMYKKGGDMIFFNNEPPSGTIKRGELFPYTLPNDSNGYTMSATVKNPFDTITKAQLAEAGRLYNINCGICHGATGVANGPIASGGYVGGVANLTAEAYIKMADGTMFHSITYGKGVMGSYSSQVTRAQRWMIIKYIRTLQPNSDSTSTAAPATTAPATTDTTAKKI